MKQFSLKRFEEKKVTTRFVAVIEVEGVSYNIPVVVDNTKSGNCSVFYLMNGVPVDKVTRKAICREIEHEMFNNTDNEQ